MSVETYDVIVVGLGGVGSSAAYHLAKTGQRVLGLDLYHPPHVHGSSHGRTRVIRQAYFEHPSYVPLLKRAYRGWDEVEQASGEIVFHRTGLIEVGPEDGVVIPGVRSSAKQYELPIEEFTMADAMQRYPGIAGPSDWRVIREVNAGYLDVERCVQTHLSLAENLGAALRYGEPMVSWETQPASVSVVTDRARYQAGSLVLAGGPWANEWLASHGIPLKILRKHLYWFQVTDQTYDEPAFPCYFFETPRGYFYGTPHDPGVGLKLARHSGGQVVESMQGQQHQPDEYDQQLCQDFISDCLPAASTTLSQWAGCYYTCTPDENFVVDTLPDSPQVTLVAGLSGHGFKFTSALGAVAAELVDRKVDRQAIDFLSVKRFLDPSP